MTRERGTGGELRREPWPDFGRLDDRKGDEWTAMGSAVHLDRKMAEDKSLPVTVRKLGFGQRPWQPDERFNMGCT